MVNPAFVDMIDTLQAGVSCARATLYAIRTGELFDTLPADEVAQDEHNHGVWLLSMLEDRLTEIQQKVDAMSVAPGKDAEG